MFRDLTDREPEPAQIRDHHSLPQLQIAARPTLEASGRGNAVLGMLADLAPGSA